MGSKNFGVDKFPDLIINGARKNGIFINRNYPRGKMEPFDLLKEGIKDLGFDLNEIKLQKFKKFLQLIIKWSEKTNITSIKKEEEIVIKHFLDSISSAKFLEFIDQRTIDIGTGAGIPGIPLKIMFPNINMVLNDSSLKKIEIVQQIIEAMELKKISAIAENAEKIGRLGEYRESFDVVTCRALAKINVIAELGLPLLKKGGKLILYKGPSAQEEVDNSVHAIQELGGLLSENSTFTLPFSDYRRTMIIVEKIGKTPEKYPRRVGIPQKRPL